MANPEHLQIRKQGVQAWVQWRAANQDIRPDLSGVNLGRAHLSEAHLSGAFLSGAFLSGAFLSGAFLSGADLSEANLRGAIVARAILHQANLTGAFLLETNFEGADLTGCVVYGIAAWNVKLEDTTQLNLVITPADEPVITVDNLEVVQFIYLLLHNEKIREVIDTIGKKGVLILGRFTDERKAVLDALRTALRSRVPPDGVRLRETHAAGFHRDDQDPRWYESVCDC